MASLDDILTAQKNGVLYLSLLATADRRIAGTVTSGATGNATLIVSGPGRLVRYSVLSKGSAIGSINNCATTAAVAVGNALTITSDTAEGVYECGLEFTQGLVLSPGSGQVISVTYTPGNWT